VWGLETGRFDVERGRGKKPARERGVKDRRNSTSHQLRDANRGGEEKRTGGGFVCRGRKAITAAAILKKGRGARGNQHITKEKRGKRWKRLNRDFLHQPTNSMETNFKNQSIEVGSGGRGVANAWTW